MQNLPLDTNDGAVSTCKDLAALLSPSPSTTTVALAAMQYDLRVLRSLRRIVRSIELHSRQLVANNKYTAPQLVCLLAVVNQGPLSATAISREVQLSASTVVGIMDRLEEKGWITRTRAHDDRRVVMVAATVEGAAIARQAPSPLQQRLALALNALPELERATIALSLERVVALMEEQVVDTSPLPGAGPVGPTVI